MKEFDTGNVILRRSVFIGGEETTPRLYDRLARLGAENLIEALSILEKGAVLSEQDTSQAFGRPETYESRRENKLGPARRGAF